MRGKLLDLSSEAPCSVYLLKQFSKAHGLPGFLQWALGAGCPVLAGDSAWGGQGRSLTLLKGGFFPWAVSLTFVAVVLLSCTFLSKPSTPWHVLDSSCGGDADRSLGMCRAQGAG